MFPLTESLIFKKISVSETTRPSLIDIPIPVNGQPLPPGVDPADTLNYNTSVSINYTYILCIYIY